MKRNSKQEPIEVIRPVKIDYSDTEINTMSKQMATCMNEQESLESEMRSVASSYKNKIEQKQTEIINLKNAISQGFQMVQKKCLMFKNFEDEVREYMYEGRIIETEPLTKEDYQLEMNLNKKDKDGSKNESKDK